MVNTVLSWIANMVFCILLIIQPRYFSNHLSKKNLRRLTTEYRAKVKAKSGVKKEKAKKAFLWKLINTVNDTEPQVWLWICRQILWICKKKTSVPVIELLPLSSKFTFHFPSVKTDLGLLNILPLSQAQSIEGAVETGGQDCCVVPAGLPPPPPQQRGSLPVSILTLVPTPQGFCPSSSSDRLPQHLAPEAHALSPAPHSCGVRWPAASPGTRLGWFYSRSASS